MLILSGKEYYHAVHLQALVYCCDTTHTAGWKGIEESTEGRHVQSLVPARDMFKENEKMLYLITALTLGIYLEREVKVLSWMAYGSNFQPGS